MAKRLVNKVLLIFGVLAFLAVCQESDPELIKCTPQQLSQTCQQENKQSVCAKDTDDQYSTFQSVCQACKDKQTVSFKYGKCGCPWTACQKEKLCFSGKCKLPLQATHVELFEAIRLNLDSNNFEKALDISKISITKDQGQPNSYYYAALATFEMEQHKQSLKYIKRAIELNDQIPEYFLLRGRVFSTLKKFDDADAQFKKVREIGFDDEGLLCFYQGQSLLRNKKNDEAIEKLQIALKHHPERADWFVRKAMAFTINKQSKMALVTCREGLKLHPNDQQILTFMRQFLEFDEVEEETLENAQQASVRPGTGDKGMDPKQIEKIMREHAQQQEFAFDMKKIQQRTKQLELQRQAQKAAKDQETSEL